MGLYYWMSIKPNLHKDNNVIMLMIGAWTSPQYINMQISFFNYCSFCQLIYVSGTWRSQSKCVVGRNKGFDSKSNNNLKSSVNCSWNRKNKGKSTHLHWLHSTSYQIIHFSSSALQCTLPISHREKEKYIIEKSICIIPGSMQHSRQWQRWANIFQGF